MGLVGEHRSYTYSNCRLGIVHRWITSESRPGLCNRSSPNRGGIWRRARMACDLRLHFVPDDSVFLACHPSGLPEQGDAAHQLT